MATTVLLTGASGFIALHIIGVLLSKGYTVIGTVRTQAQADKITENFKKEYPEGQLSFEIVPDIAAADAFHDVLKKHPEITEVLHTASPFAFGLDKSFEDAYFKPATEGTKNILQAIVDLAPQVKHVVVTSSFAAIVNADKVGDATFIHTEATWNPLKWEEVKDEFSAYRASKKYAELLARDFVKEKKPNFTITTVNPPFVLGPQKFEDVLVKPTLNTSAETVNQLLATPANETSFLEKPIGLSCDVRDVALLHVLPLEKEELAGKRLFTVNGHFIGQSLLNLIHEEFPELDGKIGKGSPEEADVKAKIAETLTYYDTSKTLEWTGIKEWTPLSKTIKDSVSQILAYKEAHN